MLRMYSKLTTINYIEDSIVPDKVTVFSVNLSISLINILFSIYVLFLVYKLISGYGVLRKEVK